MAHAIGMLVSRAPNSATKSIALQILIVAALVDFVIALLGGEGAGAFVEPAVIILILVANGASRGGDGPSGCMLGSGDWHSKHGPAAHAPGMVYRQQLHHVALCAHK